MKILLIHSVDDPEKGRWTNLPWDHVIDLGLGGLTGYARWTRQFHCPITTLDSFRNGFDTFQQVRNLLGLGCNRLMDEHGLDWWEILSILLTSEMETLLLLQRFVETIGSSDEVYVSRPGLHASLLQWLIPRQLKVFPARRGGQRSGFRHYARVFEKLTGQQMVDVFWDKYDAGYQFRGRFVQKRPPSKRGVVLLPTAYISASRTGMAYANTFPDENFFLVATRRSGWVTDPPRNVATAWLSSYAAVRDRSTDLVDIERRWQSLVKELAEVTEFEILNRTGYLAGLLVWLKHGLEVRDAWRNVLDSEPVQGVLCSDDSNPYTRIPLLLAQKRGLPNIACHHGALDGRYVFKRALADAIWVKGKLEEDYLVRKCGVPRERIEIAAPALPAGWKESRPSNGETSRPYFLFISEAAEVSGGRTAEFYRDVLPPLADLALATGRELIVKLHPAESESERRRMLARVLSARQNAATRVVSGPLTDDLLEKAWCGVTILSTVALECAVRGIPCFLCKWLDFGPYGYVDQFIRFKLGVGLNGPSEIAQIPEYMQRARVLGEVKEDSWQPVAPGRLRELLSGSRKEFTVAGT